MVASSRAPWVERNVDLERLAFDRVAHEVEETLDGGEAISLRVCTMTNELFAHSTPWACRKPD